MKKMSILITILNVVFYTSLLITQEHDMGMQQEEVNRIVLNRNPGLNPILMGLNLDGQQDDPAVERFVLKIQLMEIQEQRNNLHEQMPKHIKDAIEKHNQQFAEREQAKREQAGGDIFELIHQKEQLITKKQNLEYKISLIPRVKNRLYKKHQAQLDKYFNRLKNENQNKTLTRQTTRIRLNNVTDNEQTIQMRLNHRIIQQAKLKLTVKLQKVNQFAEQTTQTLESLDNQINLLSREIEEKHKIQKPSELQFIQQELKILKDYAEHNNNHKLETLIGLTEQYIRLLEQENNN